MAGLLDYENETNPLNMMLVLGGLGMMGAQNPAQGFGQGAAHGLLNYQQGQDKRRELEMLREKMRMQAAQEERQNRLTDAQIENYQADNEMNKQVMGYKLDKLNNPEMTSGQREAIWAAGGDEGKARDLMLQWKQNPYQALNYGLAMQNSQRADQTAQRTANSDAARIAMEEERLRLQKQAQQNNSVRDIPSSQIDAGLGDVTGLQKIDEAIKALEENPDALGAKNYAPDFFMQRIDPKGVDVRAKISDIAAQKRHDLSGAAVSISEDQRLRPFIPSASDTPEAAKQKLTNLRSEYQKIYDQRRKQFSNGYKGGLATYEQQQPAPKVEKRQSKVIGGKTYYFDGQDWFAE